MAKKFKCENPICSSDFDVIHLKNGKAIAYCKKHCLSNELSACKHHNFQIVRHNTTTRKQCLDCGNLFAPAIARPENFNDLPKSDKLYNSYLEAVEKISNIHAKKAKINHQDNEIANQKYNIAYQNYLNSDEWKKIRLKVLARDKYVCQSCLDSKATEVHHLTYRNIGREPLFDLVSVCSDCHSNKIHLYGSNDYISNRCNGQDLVEKYFF